jgi:excisionase family DNA binding protein
VTWRGRIAREILTGSGYGALADQIVEAVDATWPAGAQAAPEPEPAQHDTAAPPAKEPAEPAEYLTIATAAQYLDCSKGLIRKLLAAPDPMPSVTLGRARRIPRAALDAWVARRMAAPVGVDDVLDQIRRAR